LTRAHLDCSPSANGDGYATAKLNSTDEFATRIIEFIKAYNREAAPFRWTYDGRPLKIANSQ
jgi:hypothetical protein